MEFLKALVEAKQLGVSKEDFIRMWEIEMKLKQQREEARSLEVKFARSHIQEATQTITTGDEMKQILQNYQKEVRKQISDLRDALNQRAQSDLQVMSKLLENQLTLITVVVKNELLDIFNTYIGSMNSEPSQVSVNNNDSHQQSSTECSGRGSSVILPKKKTKKKKKKKSHVQTQHHFDHDPSEEIEIPFPCETGAVLCVSNIKYESASKAVIKSPVYILADCLSKVQLFVFLSEDGCLQVDMAIYGLSKCALKTCRIFTVTGHIENKSSGIYAPLFEGSSQPLRRLTVGTERYVGTIVCLKTEDGYCDDVTIEDLERNSYIMNDSCLIRWFVTSEEV